MKYDDAAWHSDGQFPDDSPPEYGGTHIGLLLKWCFLKGWAGDIHRQDNADDLRQVLDGKMTGTEFLFRNCDGQFTDEDLNEAGNAFISAYYADDGPYLGDYVEAFADLMYIADEREHDFRKFKEIVDRRYEDARRSPR